MFRFKIKTILTLVYYLQIKLKTRVMKKSLTIILTYILITGFTQQSSGQILTDQQKSKIEKQVDSVFHEMIKAAEKLDYDKLSTGVDDNHHAGFIVNGAYFPKYDSLASLLKTNIRDGARQIITIQKEKISVLADNIALLNAAGFADVELSPSQTFSSKFLWSFVYEKIDGDWKVIQSHQSQAN